MNVRGKRFQLPDAIGEHDRANGRTLMPMPDFAGAEAPVPLSVRKVPTMIEDTVLKEGVVIYQAPATSGANDG